MAEKSWLERHLGLVIAIVGVISAVISAYVTHHLTRSRALEESHLELRKQAYSGFLQGQALLWQAPQQAEKANRLITAAKLNILLTGSRGVVCSLASYWTYAHKYQPCEDVEEKKKDVAIYQEMRREFFQSLGATSPDLDAAIVVPYLRSCVLPGTDLGRLCASP
ncbi:MAG: hypothetical protein ACREVE_09665 [Gammaproteobacteria bacterium]